MTAERRPGSESGRHDVSGVWRGSRVPGLLGGSGQPARVRAGRVSRARRSPGCGSHEHRRRQRGADEEPVGARHQTIAEPQRAKP